MNNMKLGLNNKLFHSDNNSYNITGVDKYQWAILFQELKSLNDHLKKNIFILPTEKEAEDFIALISNQKDTLFYPSIGCEIYSSMTPSEYNLVKRISTLSKMMTDESYNVVCSLEAFLLYTPPNDFFKNEGFTIEVSDIISPHELAKNLINLGYQSAPSCEEPGTFAQKGEVFDIYPLDKEPVRLIYFDDMIEEIKLVDKHTLRSLSGESLNKINLGKTQHSLFDKDYLTNFRSQFPRPALSERDKFDYRKEILKKLNDHNFFDDYPLFISFFFPKRETIKDFISSETNCFFLNMEAIEYEKNLLSDELSEQYEQFAEVSSILKPKPNQIFNLDQDYPERSFFINNVNVDLNLDLNISNQIDLNLKPIAYGKNRKQSVLEFIKGHNHSSSKLRVYYTKESSRNEIEYLLGTYFESQTLNVSYHQKYLKEGFLYINEDIIFISENDFFNVKTKKVSQKNNQLDKDVFAEQLSTLKKGDYVIHKDFGIALYEGIETLTLSENESDYLVLKFLDNDKVYVPVYKINLIQKHSNSESNVKLSNLKTKKFEAAKSKAKSAVKKLAFDLLESQAKRELKKGYAFSMPDHDFNEFSLSFKFTETPDQIKAIEDVISDMTSSKPMDRLVCGDVGFGKTEVAMRAAYKAVQDNFQVCVLVPTTVLALQHFNSFKERFSDTAVEIDFISRFKSAKQLASTLQKIEEKKVDIIIGTHKVLSQKVKFNNLGLLIIDEEQRFGVTHKEKLKLLRENIDTLTLTATPIPRTLQMSFLGIKDLSIIKTPPPKRQSIKTYIIKEDNSTIKMAIEKELKRGGQVFIVHNKVSDIEIFTSKIRELVPSARIIYAHGQLSERDLEKRISDFYNYKYDILVATTIIESGIDIPRANTLIIDRADTYGLAQLHQLRGRIGRSDKKAYAYFMVPKFQKLSDIAGKRLKALQTYADLGAGHSLATSDLEIRGSGDILGPEQSGHIGTIGLELYMDLLKDCINEIKGQKRINHYNIEIQTNFSSYIPQNYIHDSGIRLKYYKKISNSDNLEEVDHLSDELTDLYGQPPQELLNLLTIIKSRHYLKRLAIEHVRVSGKTIALKFNKQEIENDNDLRNKVINLFTQRPKIYKINPDYSINCKFKDKVLLDDLFEFSHYLNENLN